MILTFTKLSVLYRFCATLLKIYFENINKRIEISTYVQIIITIIVNRKKVKYLKSKKHKNRFILNFRKFIEFFNK